MVAEIAALDFWTVFVSYTFGSFWLAVVGLILLFFIIMAVMGKISIETITWFNTLFLLAMALGYGLVLITTILNLALLIYFIFAWSRAVDMK